MSETTGISWTDATFNPWWGCTKVSPACDPCYAERDAKRFAPGRVLWGVGSERRRFEDKHWNEPLRWARTLPAKLGRRPRVFCASMADWLDKDAAPYDQARLLDTIRLTPELDWLLLTKRIGNWRQLIERALDVRKGRDDHGRHHAVEWTKAWLDGKPPANVWLGSTVVNQEEADRDIPKLLAVPARVRFLSIEPMLGPIDLSSIKVGGGHGLHEFDPIITGNPLRRASRDDPHVHWVIAGGESGPHARPMHPDWLRSLRDQCAAAGVPFHFKQWGEHSPGELAANPAYPDDEGSAWRVDQIGRRWHDPMESLKPRSEWAPIKFARPGKKAAGRLLDGVEHNGFPEAA
jgi:protein gp37